jgi:stage III sporulation protein AG
MRREEMKCVGKDIKKLLSKKENLIVLVLTGVLLFIIALPTENGSSSQKAGSLTDSSNGAQTDGQETDAQQSDTGAGSGAEDAGGGETKDQWMDAYARSLESRLEEILSEMESVGHVKVMITLKASEELVVEKEEPVSRSSTNETDSQGGTRIVNQVETEETTVYRTDGTTSEPYVVKTLSPEIEGVVVVAEGAGDGNVDKAVTEIAEALFGVEAHKVKVVRMEQKTGGNG